MKANCFPVLTTEVINLLSEFYVEVRQQARDSYCGKPVTARDLKSLERLTIARAKCEGRDVTKLSDAEEAIRIYTESLKSVGLDLSTAGELVGMTSDEELDIINEIEQMVNASIDFEGLKLSSETMKRLKMESGRLCNGTSLDPEVVLQEILMRCEMSL